MAALQAGEHISLSIAHADIGRLAVVLLLGDVEIAVLATADVIRAPHPGPLTEEVTVGREDLDALVRSIGHIKLAVVVGCDAVRQVKLAFALARRAPRFDKPAVAREAVHAGVAVAVGY